MFGFHCFAVNWLVLSLAIPPFAHVHSLFINISLSLSPTDWIRAILLPLVISAFVWDYAHHEIHRRGHSTAAGVSTSNGDGVAPSIYKYCHFEFIGIFFSTAKYVNSHSRPFNWNFSRRQFHANDHVPPEIGAGFVWLHLGFINEINDRVHFNANSTKCRPFGIY